ncbi:MAG: protein kinase [Actinomycetota bacterium]|nr:protein kinase [Actinomycetota bacterium]
MTAPGILLAGRYRLVKVIAAGGMGSVWEAWDELLHRRVAVKQLLPQPGLTTEEAALARSRVIREARITARLHHPNAVTLYDVVEQDGRPCLIMQFVPSRSLNRLLADEGVLQPSFAARLGSEVASALAAAHQVGIVHRDVKPSNVLITDDGSAKLTDFGISHAAGDVTVTSTGMLTGTPAFLAPEVARGAKSGFPADVYSLGATLYAALEGTPPFGTDQNPMALLHRVASGQMIPPHRSGTLTPLLLRMLAREPTDRPAMDDVARTLSRQAAGVSDPAPPQSPATSEAARMISGPPPVFGDRTAGSHTRTDPARRRRTGALLAAIVAVVVVAALVTALLLLRPGTGGGRANPPAPSSGNAPASSTEQTTPKQTTPTRPAATPARGAATTSLLQPPPPVSTRSVESIPAKSASAPSTATPTTGPAVTTAPSTSTSSTHSDKATLSDKPKSSDKPSTTASSGSAASPPTAAELAAAITDYYALLPSDTDQGWARLTTHFQTTTAHDRQYYQRFWDSIDRVTVRDAVGSPPNATRATITYHFKDGKVSVESTVYTLVQDAGILKIDDSKVPTSNGQ